MRWLLFAGLFALVILLLVLTCSRKPTEPDVPLPGLIHSWNMNEVSGTRADSIGSADLLESAGAVGSNPENISPPRSAHFDGSAIVLSAEEATLDPGFPGVVSTDFTASAWIYPLESVNNIQVIRHGEDVPVTWNIALTGLLPLAVLSPAVGPDRAIFNSGNLAVLNAWNHLAIRLFLDEFSFWVNGEKVPSSETGIGDIDTTGVHFMVGNSNRFTPTTTKDCYIDDVRVYNRGLSDSEIQQLAQQENPTRRARVPINSVPLVWIDSGNFGGAVGPGATVNLDLSARAQAQVVQDAIPPRMLAGTLRSRVEDISLVVKQASAQPAPDMHVTFYANDRQNTSDLSDIRVLGDEDLTGEFIRVTTSGTTSTWQAHVGNIQLPYVDEDDTGEFHVAVTNESTISLADGDVNLQFSVRPETLVR